MKDYEEAVDCDRCDLAAVRIFTAPAMVTVKQDIRYTSPVDGAPITSWAARKEDLKRHGCIEYDPEMKKDAHRRSAEGEDATDRAIEQSVGETIARMPAKKRAKLKKEVIGQGAELNIVRSTC